MTSARLRMIALLAAALLMLSGCISFGPSPVVNPKGVTLSGTVRTSVAPSVVATSNQTQAGKVPVTVMRVTADGQLVPLGIIGTTDDQGRYTLSGVPDRTHVVVQADVTAQAGERAKSVVLLSTAVTQGNTKVDVDPLHHIAYEVIRKYAEVSFALWKLDVPPNDLQQIISVTTDIFMSDILPQVGPPPEISEWDEPMACEGITYGAPIVPSLECYMAHVDQTIMMSPTLVERVNEILEPHIPSKILPRVSAGTVTVDGLPNDWAGIEPITVSSDGIKSSSTRLSALSGASESVTLLEMYLASDGEYMNVLINLGAEEAPADWPSYRLQFFAGAGLWETSVNVNFEPDWVYAHSGSGVSYDPALVEWKQEGSYLELRFPYAWLVDVFGDDPCLVLVHSDAPPEHDCGTEPMEQPDCFVAGWRDVLPVVRVLPN